MYYRFMENYEEMRCRIEQEPDLSDENFRLYKGEYISHDEAVRLPKPLVFPVDCNNELKQPNHLTGISIPLMSHELVSVLQKNGVDNLQQFPAILRNEETGDEWGNYYAVNIVGLISCADMEKSDYTQIGARPNSDIPLAHFHNLVIDEERAHGHYLFRLAEEPHVIVASEEIYKATDTPPSKGRWGINLRTLD